MKKHVRLWVGASMLLVLSACGGGSDEGPAAVDTAAVDMFVGNWSGACQIDVAPGLIPSSPDGFSSAAVIEISKVSDTELRAVTTETIYVGNECSGASEVQEPSVDRLTFTGTVTIGADVAYKFLAVGPAMATKGLLLLKDGRLYGNDWDSPVDADGYHTAIDFSDYLTK